MHFIFPFFQHDSLAVDDYRYSQPYVDPQLSQEQTEILNRRTNYSSQKSHYPYTWCPSYQKMHFEHLPSQDSFFNDLTENNISSKCYQHCLKTWNEFEMTKFQHYHLLYNLTDLLILTDVMLFFRNQIRQDLNLDFLEFYSMPVLALKSALKYSGTEIQLLTEMGMHLFSNSKSRG